MQWQNTFVVTPADFCRSSEKLNALLASNRNLSRAIISSCATIGIATAAYGFTFGVWRSPLQGFFSAVKMPLLFFSTVAASALIITMLAQVLGSRLSLQKVCFLVLTGMTVSAVVMMSLAPVMMFFILQLPSPDPAVVGLPRAHPHAEASMRTYYSLLIGHVAVVGFSGLAGNVHLYRLIRSLTGSPRQAMRLTLTWIAVLGFVGCELSWLLSPFMCVPVLPPHMVAKLYFEFNFYEYVWHALSGCM